MLARRDRDRFTVREQRKTSLLALVCFLFLVWTTWGVGAQIVLLGFPDSAARDAALHLVQDARAGGRVRRVGNPVDREDSVL